MSELAHRIRRMGGRDPHEPHRVATTLELLFDLTFVIAYGTAASELAHFLAVGHVGAGIAGFCFVAFGVAWAWINFSWFASAYDTDDWVYRLTTMLQMCGVLVFSLGIPPLFDSLVHEDYVDNRVIVIGYVVMRVAMVFQWLRASRQDAARAKVARAYVVTIVVAQVGWVVQAFARTSPTATVVWIVVLMAIELGGPLYSETRLGGTPWHPHHIAERYGAVIIIALGEGMIGTMAAMNGVLAEAGWSTEFVVVLAAGVAIVFGIWWCYFVIPCGELLAGHRERSFGWGYGHIVVFAAVVAVGAGLHVAGYHLDHAADPTTPFSLGARGTLLASAVPLLVFLVGLFVMYAALTRSFDRLHVLLIVLTVADVAVAVLLAGAGVGLHWCLAVLALAPWVTVVGYELAGYRHNAKVLAGLE